LLTSEGIGHVDMGTEQILDRTHGHSHSRESQNKHNKKGADPKRPGTLLGVQEGGGRA
jgi:hypothetical protein